MFNKIDQNIGSRLRNRRQNLGISQQKLGQSVGVTFQQIQKYEKGTNRVSASRLYKISETLDVSLDYFFNEAAA